jgi:hypothetical protein
MPNVKISVQGPANRPHLWDYFYETLSMNTIDFEIVFVGNVKPDFKLPDNFKFIYSNVNPAQCEFISSLYSSGELLLTSGDDFHYSPYCLDMLYEKYRTENDYKCMVSVMKYAGITDHIETSEDISKILDKCPNQEGNKDSMFKNIQLSVSSTMSRQFYRELGGLDKRFIFGNAATDLLVRAVHSGGRFVFCPDTYMIERKDLCGDWQNAHGKLYSDDAYKFLLYEWADGDIVKPKRTDEVQPYIINDTLLLFSQGERGEWD